MTNSLFWVSVGQENKNKKIRISSWDYLPCNQAISLAALIFTFPMFNPVPSNLVWRLTDAIFCLTHTTSYNTRNNTINTIPPRNGYSMICTAFKPLWVCCFGISSVQIQLQLPSHLSGLTVLRIPTVSYLRFLCDAIPNRLLWHLRSLWDLCCTLRLRLYILLSGHNEGQS